MKQFNDVNSQYGAPMGRQGHGLPCHTEGEGRTIRLFRVRLDSGGYDDGGAYWGIGQRLYCATDGADYRQFVRADNRFHACALLEIEPDRLTSGLQLPGAYSASGLQFNGHQTARFVLRFREDYISAHATKDEMTGAALSHYLARDNALRGQS